MVFLAIVHMAHGLELCLFHHDCMRFCFVFQISISTTDMCHVLSMDTHCYTDKNNNCTDTIDNKINPSDNETNCMNGDRLTIHSNHRHLDQTSIITNIFYQNNNQTNMSQPHNKESHQSTHLLLIRMFRSVLF